MPEHRITLVCAFCGGTFYRFPSNVGKYCSASCRSKAPRRRLPLADRIWPRVDKTDGCWNWTGPVNGWGYGQIHARWHQPPTPLVHRLVYEMLVGPIPDGISVLHRCDNTRCCNPDHLFLGTHQDNMADKVAKGRGAFGERNGAHTRPEMVRRGANHGQAKLTDSQVLEIRSRYAAGGLRQSDLAAEYGVSDALIGVITRREGWKHLA